jgi:hypothetical protein
MHPLQMSLTKQSAVRVEVYLRGLYRHDATDNNVRYVCKQLSKGARAGAVYIYNQHTAVMHMHPATAELLQHNTPRSSTCLPTLLNCAVAATPYKVEVHIRSQLQANNRPTQSYLIKLHVYSWPSVQHGVTVQVAPMPLQATHHMIKRRA